MLFLTAIVVVVHLVLARLVWRAHKRAYYELEKRVEARLGPVRDFPDGVGEYALTTSGLIPYLKKLQTKYGSQLSGQELALLRKSRICYYVSGAWGILIFVGILSAVSFTILNVR